MFLKGSGCLGPMAISLWREWAWRDCEEEEEEEGELRQEMKTGSRTPNISDSEGERGGKQPLWQRKIRGCSNKDSTLTVSFRSHFQHHFQHLEGFNHHGIRPRLILNEMHYLWTQFV